MKQFVPQTRRNSRRSYFAPLVVVTPLLLMACGAAMLHADPATRPTTRRASATTLPGVHPVQQRVVAHGWDNWYWLAIPTTNGAGKQTGNYTIVARRGDSRWVELRQVGQPVVSLANRDAELAVLLADGEWITVTTPDEFGQTTAASGQKINLPGAKLLALTGDTNGLLALAELPGGIAALPPTPKPPPGMRSTSVQDLASTQPTTQPGTQPSTQASTQPATITAAESPATNPTTVEFAATMPALPATLPFDVAKGKPAFGPTTNSSRGTSRSMRYAVVRFGQGGWKGVADIPGSIAQVGHEVSIAATPGNLYIGVRSSYGLEIYRLDSTVGVWAPIGNPLPIDGDQPFKLLTGTPVPTLWIGGAADEPDTLFRLIQSQEPKPSKLQPLAATDPLYRAPAYASGAIRVVGWQNGKFVEYAFDAQTAEPLGSGREIGWAESHGTPSLMSIGMTIVTIAMLFSIFASMRQWPRMRDASPEALAEAGVKLAPLGKRVLAGVIDAVPVIGGTVLMALRVGNSQTLASVEVWVEIIRWSGIAVYILHTLLSELLVGRSIGKIICGLRVVGLDGQPATAGQYVVRNLLRVIDAALWFLPVALVPFSPLRQRAGDAAAGTLVVAPLDGTETPAEEDEEESADQ